MPAMDIPDPLPPAITPPRTVIEFLADQDLKEFGDTGLVARTWHWVLHGGGPRPISHMDPSQFDGDRPPPLPRKAPPLHPPTHGLNSTKPDSSAGYAPPTPETKYRCDSPWDATPAPAITEDGPVAVTMRDVTDGQRACWRPRACVL